MTKYNIFLTDKVFVIVFKGQFVNWNQGIWEVEQTQTVKCGCIFNVPHDSAILSKVVR